MTPHLCTTLTTWNTRVNNCIISHAQNTTALQPNILVTAQKQGTVTFSRAHHCQGQLQTPVSIYFIQTNSRTLFKTHSHLKH